MSETLKRDQWNNSTTFGKFNNKPIHEEGPNQILKDNSFLQVWHWVLFQLKFYRAEIEKFVRRRVPDNFMKISEGSYNK